MKKLLILIVIAFTINTNAQESTLLRLNYKKGDVYKMVMTQNVSSAQMVLDMKINSELTVLNVNGDIYESETKFTKLVVDLMQGTNMMSYDSSKSDDELDQMGLMLKTQMSPMLSAVISTKGNNLGEVIESKTSIPFQGSENLGESNVIYPKEAVRVGDTFKMDKSAAGVTINMVYTVKSILNDKVILDLAGSGSAKIKGTLTIDRATGVTLKMDIVTEVVEQGVTTTVGMITTKQ
ncbi:hypothetical protein [Polaribacter uvawellassae]|uniref:hypothetical protein n=1 Tax=Polaribacter uvawellassae TaxID=3133495 RepID=UPI003218F191